MTAFLEQFTYRSILAVEGTLRAPVSTELSQRVQALLLHGERRIVLDLSRLSAIDAAGVGELVRALNTTNAEGGALRIAHAGGRVLHLLDIAGVLRFLTDGAQARCA